MTDAVTAVHDVFVLAHLGIPRVDGGRSFTQATLEPRRGRARQRFALSWLAAEQGEVQLCVRAIEADGTSQPRPGARNAIHTVRVTVGLGS